MIEWKEFRLADICTDISYGYTESASDKKIGPKFLRITDIVPQRIDWETVPYCKITDKDYKKYKLEFGDIVIARTGATTGYNKIIKDETECVFASYLIRYKIDNRIANPFYVGYILQSSNWYDYVNAIAGGSAQPGANAKQLGSFEIVLPSLPEQNVIASVLGSLDTKIDLLNRQNKTLEAMAETLFRQWFIKDVSENQKVSISAFAENIRVNAKVESLSEYKFYIGLEHIPRKSISLINWGNTNTLESNKSVFERNDILFGKLRSYFHKVVFAPFSGVCSTDILVIRPKKVEWFPFCLLWFFNKDLVGYSDLGSGGTRMPRTSWEIISNFQVPKPDSQLINRYNEIVLPMISKIDLNIRQIQTLEKLRDTLLPKLMSGEVQVLL